MVNGRDSNDIFSVIRNLFRTKILFKIYFAQFCASSVEHLQCEWKEKCNELFKSERASSKNPNPFFKKRIDTDFLSP